MCEISACICFLIAFLPNICSLLKAYIFSPLSLKNLKKILNLAPNENLKRDITRIGLTALVLNGVIGAGIFALPSSVAELTGALSPLMFVICGVLILPVVISFGQAASYFRNTGGPVLYAGTAFGPFVGFQAGWLLYLGRMTAFAANSNALVNYAGFFWTGVQDGVGRIVALAICFLALTTVNLMGVKKGISAINLLTVLKLVPLLLFIGFGFVYIAPEKFMALSGSGFDRFAESLLLVVYAYVGFEGAVIPAGECRNPRKDIPTALIKTILITGVLYVLIQTVCISVLPDLGQTKTPIADVAKVMFGSIGAQIMTLAAFFSIAGNLSAIVIAAPRMTYALAREHSLPAWFGKVHEKYKTPSTSILFLGGVGFILAVSGSFAWLAIMSSLARLLGYAITISALPRLKKMFGSDSDGFKVPGGHLVPAVALVVCVWLALQADLRTWGMTGGFVLFGSFLYGVARWQSRKISPDSAK